MFFNITYHPSVDTSAFFSIHTKFTFFILFHHVYVEHRNCACERTMEFTVDTTIFNIFFKILKLWVKIRINKTIVYNLHLLLILVLHHNIIVCHEMVIVDKVSPTVFIINYVEIAQR